MELSGQNHKDMVSSTTITLPSTDKGRILDQNHLYNHHQFQSHNPTRNPTLIQDLAPHLAPAPALATSTGATTSPFGGSISPGPSSSTPSVKYKECQKNHAASMGGHVVDGCGEFMPGGEEGSLEALNCAACQCHRSFHRKDIEVLGGDQEDHQYNINAGGVLLVAPPLHAPPMMMNFGGGGAAAMESSSGQERRIQALKKRFRTKFSEEQRVKMMEFAEKLEWKMQKREEEEVRRFCSQVGVERKVFKVWMHNNKQAMKKKQVM